MRPTVDEYFIQMALLVATRGTCLRRQVGCVLVDEFDHVLATGYNGVASGLFHCNEHDPYDPIGYPHACEGAHAASGTQLDKCQAIHAEINALLQCTRPHDIYKVYTTVSPCIHCTRALLNTPAQELVFAARYPHPEAEQLWQTSGRKWTLHSGKNMPVESAQLESGIKTASCTIPIVSVNMGKRS